MAAPKLKPDYKAWWNKEDLSEDDLSWLVLGVDPDDARKASDFLTDLLVDDDNLAFRRAFNNYTNTLPHGAFLGHTRKRILEAKLWDGDKKGFIKSLYERLPILILPEDFKSFLSQQKILPTHYDHYKDHAKYQDSLVHWALADIDDEDTALSLLVGMNPTEFARLYTLTRRMKNGEDWADFEPDDKHFYHYCATFLKKEYPNLDMYSETWLMNFCHAAKGLSLWDGDFAAYAQALHDEGFIFRKKTYDALEHHKIIPSYSSDGWAIQFCGRWLKEGIWSFKEALHLFKGQDPRQGQRRSFRDIGQYDALYAIDSGTILSWDAVDADFFHLDKRLERHLAAGLIKPVPLNGWKNPTHDDDDVFAGDAYSAKQEPREVDKLFFKPEDIVKWLLDHTLYTPPEAILTSVLGEREYKKYAGAKKERQKAQSLSSDEYKAGKWMKEQIDQGANHGTKDNWLAALRELIPALTGRQFDRVWADKATPEMKAPGRRDSQTLS